MERNAEERDVDVNNINKSNQRKKGEKYIGKVFHVWCGRDKEQKQVNQ